MKCDREIQASHYIRRRDRCGEKKSGLSLLDTRAKDMLTNARKREPRGHSRAPTLRKELRDRDTLYFELYRRIAYLFP